MPIASGFRVPIFSVDFDPSAAGGGDSTLQYNGLLIGQMSSAGSATPLTLVTVNSYPDAIGKFGAGSHLALMAKYWFLQNTTTPLWAIAMAMPGDGAVQSVRTFNFGGTATVAGNLYWYVDGLRCVVAVAVGDTSEIVATNSQVALSQLTDSPFTFTTAETDGGYNLVMTAICAGQVGDRLDARMNYQDGEQLPAGITVNLSSTLDGGSHDPAISAAVAVMGDKWFQTIVSAYSPDFGTDNVSALEAELVDRFGPVRMIDGTAFLSPRGTNLSSLESVAAEENSEHLCVPHSYGLLIAPNEWAATVAAIVAREAQIDPAVPLTDLQAVGVSPPCPAAQFTITENNLLLHDAISTFFVALGLVKIQRLITTYTADSNGNSDTSFLNLETMNTLRYLRFDFRRQMSAQFSRAKLADDSAYIPPGQVIMTPTVGAAAAIAIFKSWMQLGLVTNLAAFKANLTVARDPDDATRMNFLLPPSLIGQLIVTSASIQFRTQ